MDWNYFYSSLAQSVAALVGIFSAFIITNVIGNKVTFKQNSSRIQDLLTEANRYKELFSARYVDWFCERTREESFQRLAELLGGNECDSAEDYYESSAFPIFEPRKPIIKKIEIQLKTSKPEGDDSESESETESIHQLISYENLMTDNMRAINRSDRIRLQDSIEKEEEAIKSLIIDIKHHAKISRHHWFLVKDDSESNSLITFSIVCAIVLFLSGVIYPLSFLPANPAGYTLSVSQFFYLLCTLKGLLLLIPSVIFSFILLVFVYININLRYDKTEVAKLEQSTSIESYSPYLKIMEDNQKQSELYKRKKKEPKNQKR